MYPRWVAGSAFATRDAFLTADAAAAGGLDGGAAAAAEGPPGRCAAGGGTGAGAALGAVAALEPEPEPLDAAEPADGLGARARLAGVCTDCPRTGAAAT